MGNIKIVALTQAGKDVTRHEFCFITSKNANVAFTMKLYNKTNILTKIFTNLTISIY